MEITIKAFWERPQVDFPRRDNARLQAALENTHRLVWVRNIKQTRMARMGQLVGFARATSDKVRRRLLLLYLCAP